MSNLKHVSFPYRCIGKSDEQIVDRDVEPTSMLYWLPIVETLDGIRVPKTVLVPVDPLECFQCLDGNVDPFRDSEVGTNCELMGYPVFVRTDLFSGKHSWSNTCFVEDRGSLMPNLFRLLDESAMRDLEVNAIAIREYIPMATLFYAFYGKMPVNPEIRFFARDGKIECQHWYWIPDAIKKSGAPVFDLAGSQITESEWTHRLDFARQSMGTDEKELLKIELLNTMATVIAAQFEGYWSIDFCLSKTEGWVLIDMAEGDKSWHPDDCEFKR